MMRLCIKDFQKDGLVFCRGLKYKVDLNSVDGLLYIYTPFGYTDIPKEVLDECFL